MTKAAAMLRNRLRSLRVRLAILVAAVVVTTVAAALVFAWALSVTNGAVAELSSAQRRLEDLSTASSRVGDYALAALQTTETHELQTDRLSLPRKGIQEAFERFRQDIEADVARLGAAEGQALQASRGRALAYMRAHFGTLDREVMQAIREGRAGGEANQQKAEEKVRASIDFFASSFGPALGQAIASERAAARDAEQEMGKLRSRFAPLASLAIAVAVLFALALYRSIALPLLRRMSEVAGAAADVTRGRTDIRLAPGGHDEFGLLTMRFNRMAISLARRERRLLAAQSQLQEIVDARTAELRGANERLSDIDKARRRFFTDVSHELRTPLTVILGEVDVTLRGKPAPEDLTSALATIRARARRLHRRVEDLLRVARSESGELDLDLEPIALANLVDQAREGVLPAATARGLTVKLGDMPGDLLVEADPEWLRQVIEGLIANAIRHSTGGGQVRLDVSEDVRGSAIITVADDGEGIPAADLPHVFERFYRGVSEKEGSGFGIGLSLARWIVERHGGRITIDSQTGGPGVQSGTCVTITLPTLTPRLAFGAGQ